MVGAPARMAAQPRSVADHADQTVFGMSWRRSPKNIARRALSSLGFNQSKLVGIVVNEVDDDVLADESGVPRSETAARHMQASDRLMRAA
mgnify:CR=1 FL=1